MREIKTDLDLLRLRDYNVYVVSDVYLTTDTQEWIPYKIYYVPYMGNYIRYIVGRGRKTVIENFSSDKFLNTMLGFIYREYSSIHEYSQEEFDKILDKTDMLEELIK